MLKKIGILTSGGDCAGLNAVIRAVTIRAVNEYKIKVSTNYMIGFPDESREEIETTINFAKKMYQHGLDASNFSLVMPVPGTPIFDYCTKEKQLPPDYNPDKFQWTKANLKNLAIPPDELEAIRKKAWNDCNSEQHKKSRLNWSVPS